MNTRTPTCVMIAPEAYHAIHFRDAISSSYTFELIEWQKRYPEEGAFLRMLRLGSPDLLIVDFTDQSKALRIVALTQQHAPNSEILALCEENISILSTLLRAGVRNYITSNASFHQIAETLKEQSGKLSKRPQFARTGGDVITFLPAKPGSGASTIAANAAYAASQIPGKRTLLADFDRNSGVLCFLFNLRVERNLRDALQAVEYMDGDMWARIRSHAGDLDILPADLDTASYIDGSSTNRLIQFFRRVYDLSCIDLSGQLDSTAIEALLESKRIYIVCTQEIACQHLVLRKVERLRRAGIDKQMRLIVNRFLPRHTLTVDRISDLTGVPVEMTIPNDYEAANASMENGTLVKSGTGLGRSYKKLAEIMLDDRIEVPKSKPRFLEFFAQPFMKSAEQS